jgi:Protein of unknown function (DUF3455)
MKPFHLLSLAAVLAAACAKVPFVQAPETLRPAAGESAAMTVVATGVQIYECRERKDSTGYEWAFVRPEAELFDSHGRRIGRHGTGPFWQLADGSRVVGTVKARADAPAADAISWLLLSAKSDGSTGALSKVTSIQRVNTAGGTAPVTPCTRATAGTPARVPYTADYVFFSAH